jgi:hypothetical protein
MEQTMSVKNDINPFQYKKAITLINEWMNDPSRYDELNWNQIEQRIEENRLSHRKQFDDNSNHAGYGTTRQNNTSTA